MSSRNRLRNVNVSDDEFNHLRSHFLDEIFIRDKIFDKSMPNEFDSFAKFIDQTKPFDIVIDGLNVAYSTQTLKPLVAANIVRNFFFVELRCFFRCWTRQELNEWTKKFNFSAGHCGETFRRSKSKASGHWTKIYGELAKSSDGLHSKKCKFISHRKLVRINKN